MDIDCMSNGRNAEMRLAGREQSPTLAGKKGVTKPLNANK